MRFFFNVVVFLFFFVSIAAAQELTREQKVQKFEELNSQIKTLGDDIIAPSAKDLKQAQKEGFNVVRLLPRERYDHKLTVQGGGSYYSFTTGSHDYQKIAQVGLEQNNLKVGFAGVDYGFIADLSEMPLTDITEETAEMNFLINYKPPTNEADVRVEARKAHRFEMNGSTYKDRIKPPHKKKHFDVSAERKHIKVPKLKSIKFYADGMVSSCPGRILSASSSLSRLASKIFCQLTP